MRIEQFQYLTDLYLTKSITKTAEKFFVSRQVVSHSLREMEKELDMQLLERGNNMVDFTEAGKSAVEKAEKIVLAYEDFLSIVTKKICPEYDDEILHIYAIPRMISTILPNCLNHYKQLYPDVQIKIHSILQVEKIMQLISLSTENAVGLVAYLDSTGMELSEPFPLEQYPQLLIQPFIEAEFCLCMCKNSKYDRKKIYSTEDLKTLPLLSYEPAFLQLCGKLIDIPMNIVGTVNDLMTIHQMVLQDIGVGLLTVNEFNLLKNARNLVLKPIHSTNSTTLYYGCVYHQNQCIDSALTKFIETVPKYSKYTV